MHKHFIFFIVFFISSIIASAQTIEIKVDYIPLDKTDGLLIPYKYGQQLKWPDFMGVPADTSNTSAITSSGIGYKFKLHRTEDLATFTFTVNCTFSKMKSWVAPGKANEYILNHEQKHFDITYINTLLFIKKLKDANFTVKNYRNEISKIYQNVSTALSTMQYDYDTQTQNGINKEKQEEWNKKIASQLDNLQSEVIVN